MLSKKIVCLYFLIATLVLLPFRSSAFFRIPDPANLTIVVIASGGDDTFHFNINNGHLGTVLVNSIDLQTVSGTVSQKLSLSTFGSDAQTYYINPSAPSSWQSDTVSCVTDNPSNIISTGSFIEMDNLVSDSNTTCVFNYSKPSTKTPILIIKI